MIVEEYVEQAISDVVGFPIYLLIRRLHSSALHKF